MLSGRVDGEDKGFPADAPGAFTDLLGPRIEETDSQEPDAVNPVRLAGTAVAVPARHVIIDPSTRRRMYVGRLRELVGRPDRHPTPDRTRTPADRRDHRALGHDVLARPGRRLPVRDERGRSVHRSGVGAVRQLPHRGRRAARRRAAGPARTPDRDLRRQRSSGARGDGVRAAGLGIPDDLSVVVGYDDIAVRSARN